MGSTGGVVEEIREPLAPRLNSVDLSIDEALRKLDNN